MGIQLLGPRSDRADRASAPTLAARTLTDAAVAPITRAGRGTTVTLALLALPILAAVLAFGYQVVEGLGVTGLGDQVFWGVYEVNLVTFIGFSYGGALVSAILRLTNASWRGPIVRIAEGTALVTLLIGAAFPIVHLGRPDRMWELFTRPQLHSPIFWDMVAILTYLLVTVLLLTLPLIPDFARLRDRTDVGRFRAALYRVGSVGWRGTVRQRHVLERALSVLAIAVIPVAVMVHTVLSYAFSLTSRPGWHSTIFGPYFVLAAIYSGVAIVIVAAVAYRRVYGLQAWITDRSIRLLGTIMAALGAIYAYFLFTETTVEGYVGEEAAQALLHMLLLERYAPLYWAFVVLGVAVPLLVVAIPRTRTVTGIAAAAVLVIAAMWVKRFLMFVPALERPTFGDAIGSYSPTLVEWTITAGAVAAVPFLLIVLFRLVPVLAVDEIDQLQGASTAHPDVPQPAGGET
jgi:Ni/Fe-hydrogenase subunit HybB-like protein